MNKQDEINKAITQITAIIEKYTDQIELLDIIDIVDNLRVLAELAEDHKNESGSSNVA